MKIARLAGLVVIATTAASLAVAASASAAHYSAVARATGIGQETIRRGVRELESGWVLDEGRVRRRGAGNKSVSETHPGIEEELERLVASQTRGDPCPPSARRR
jgi:transposase-like protein